MQRLYQWLTERASVLHSYSARRGAERTVRTEATFERQRTTLLLSGPGTAGLDVCPLCGNPLACTQPDWIDTQAGKTQSAESVRSYDRTEG